MPFIATTIPMIECEFKAPTFFGLIFCDLRIAVVGVQSEINSMATTSS
jgi:hypothetical protein